MVGRILAAVARMMLVLFLIAIVSKELMYESPQGSNGPKFVRPNDETAQQEDPNTILGYDATEILAIMAETAQDAFFLLIGRPKEEEPLTSLEQLEARNR